MQLVRFRKQPAGQAAVTSGKKILINIEPEESRACVLVDGKLDELFVERPDDHTVVGNIYKGRVDSIVTSIGAYFVDIGLQKKGFLYIKDAKNPLLEEETEGVNGTEVKESGQNEFREGEEVLVQVVKEPFSTKGARLTTHITIPGRYLVLVPNESGVSISRKIENREERDRLRKIIKEINLPGNVGFIIRTAALGKQKKDLTRDIDFLLKVWDRTKKLSRRRKPPFVVYEEYELPLRVIRDVYVEDIDKILVDSKMYYKNISRFVRTYMPHLSNRVEFFKGDVPLFEKESVEAQIQSLHEPVVKLKSGAYIIVEPTEGVLVIDVNSGKFKGSKDQEEMAYSVNLEAANEIARQLRLRDIGGLIVIDFIDMSRESDRRRLVSNFENLLSRDRAKTELLGVSKFGILEMARQRVRRTLESIYYQNCPYCKGRGKIKSDATIVTHILRELKQRLSQHPKGNVVTIKLNPKISGLVEASYKQSLYTIQRHFHKRIDIISDSTLHIEEMFIA